MSALEGRLRRLGMPERVIPQFVSWCRRSGYLDVASHSEQGLRGRIEEFRYAATGLDGRVTLSRPAARPTVPEPRAQLCWFPPEVHVPPVTRGGPR